MPLQMVGIDIKTAGIAQREKFSFSEKRLPQLLTEILQQDGIYGCVLLATCNRTELYLSIAADCQLCPELILLHCAGVSDTSVEGMLVMREEEQAAAHLIEVACGLHSQVLHEEQIVTQVQHAISLAREYHTTDAMLDTLFRTAVSAGKDALTQVSMPLPLSVSEAAVQKLQKVCGTLAGKKAVVVGNGKMGRLAAELLLTQGCTVTVTLRSYHHGETVVPFGMETIPYEQRFLKIDGADIVISATRSPHETITRAQLEALDKPPVWILDLALPRDVEDSCHDMTGVHLWNLEDLSANTDGTQAIVAALQKMAETYLAEFQQWRHFRESIPYIQELKQLAAERILHSTEIDAYRNIPELEKLVQLTAEKTVDMLLGGMKSEITAELMHSCCEKMQARARLPEKRRKELRECSRR